MVVVVAVGCGCGCAAHRGCDVTKRMRARPGVLPTARSRSGKVCPAPLRSRPYESMFWPSSVTSLYPSATSSLISAWMAAMGRDCSEPRVVGTTQKVHRSLQP